MSPHGAHRVWLRTAAAAGASLLALSSTGALVTAAVVGHPGSVTGAVLVDSQGNDNGQGNGNGNGENKHRSDERKAIIAAIKKHEHPPVKPPVKLPHPTPQPHPTPAVKPPAHVRPGVEPAAVPPALTHRPAPAKPAPTARVMVDTSDPAPFSAEPVAATDVARVLPIERLGPLSGISFGSGLFIWPLLLAVDVFALAVLTRMALRRRLASPED